MMMNLQELVGFLGAMIIDYEQKYDVVVDRSEFDGDIVVPQHLRKSGGGFLNHRVSGGLLGSLTRSRTLLTMSGGGPTGAGMVHGSVPDLSRSSITSGIGSSMGTGSGKGSLGGTPLLEESSDYKLKEAASGSESALDMDPALVLGSNQKITKSRGKKLYGAKSTNYLLGDDEVQLRRDSEDYYRGRQSASSGGGGGGDGFEVEGHQQQQPSQLLKSFQSRNLSLDRPTWNGGSSPPPPPSRASSTAMLQHHHHFSSSSVGGPHFHHAQGHNHYHYDPTRYQSDHSSQHHQHTKQNHHHISQNNSRPSMKSGSTNSISIMSVNNKSNGTSTHHTPSTHAPPSSSTYSTSVRRWDEGRSSLSRRPNTLVVAQQKAMSASTTSLNSLGSSSRRSSLSSGKSSSARAKHQLELQKMKEFNSYAAIGSLDRKKLAAAQKAKRKSAHATDDGTLMTMTLDRPRSHVNNTGGGGDKIKSHSSDVVAIRTSSQSAQGEHKVQIELSNGGGSGIEGGGHGAYKIPRPAMERSLSEQQRLDVEQRFGHNDMGIEIVDKPRGGGGGTRIVLRSFGGSRSDAQVLFCESSSDGDFVAVDFVDDGEEEEGEEATQCYRDPDERNLGFNDSAA